MQDTAHFGLFASRGSAKLFDVESGPLGGAVERKLSGDGTATGLSAAVSRARARRPITPDEEIDAILAELKKTPAIGKKPTQPLCYGGWMPLGLENDYGRKYAQLYAALGFRSLHPATQRAGDVKNLQAAGMPPSKSWAVIGYRNPPTRGTSSKPANSCNAIGMEGQLRLFDYGDEIAFSRVGAAAACRARSTRPSGEQEAHVPIDGRVASCGSIGCATNRPGRDDRRTTGWKTGARSTPACCGPTAAPRPRPPIRACTSIRCSSTRTPPSASSPSGRRR